jgi:hypothetical protein
MEKPEESGFGFKQSFNLVTMLAFVHAMAILPFIRRNFGSQFFGLTALGTIALLFFLSAYDAIMMTYLLIWIGLVAIHRTKAVIRERRGEICHSRYWGDSWLKIYFPKPKSQIQARVAEGALCLIAGACIGEASAVLGKFVLLGAISIPLTTGLAEIVQANRVRRLRDSVIEQQYLSARYRGTLDDE